MEGAPPSPGGLRAFKKARTRRAISDIATRLFVQEGFERVTVAQIAQAAEVSVKTVFNYFASKEELFFDRADDVLDALVDAIHERPAGTTILESLHGVLADRRVPFDRAGWAPLADPQAYEAFRAFVETEHASTALRARRLVIADGWSRRLAGALATELRLPRDDVGAATLAAMIVATVGLRERELSGGMLERRDPAEIEARVRAVVEEALGRLARAFGELDHPREPGGDVVGG
jgi:AcrR family transcriptional regulator